VVLGVIFSLLLPTLGIAGRRFRRPTRSRLPQHRPDPGRNGRRPRAPLADRGRSGRLD
jgi:hypothetical protein